MRGAQVSSGMVAFSNAWRWPDRPQSLCERSAPECALTSEDECLHVSGF
jgi:hypothetical protein